MFKYSQSLFARVATGSNALALLFAGVAFFLLFTYRYNEPLYISQVAPNFTMTMADGQTFNLYDIKMPVVLVFYSEPRVFANNLYGQVYKRTIPKLNFIQDLGLAQVVVLFKNADTAEDIARVQEKHGYLKGISFAGDTVRVGREYGIRSWPHVYVLDSQHRVRYHNKIISDDSILKALRGQ